MGTFYLLLVATAAITTTRAQYPTLYETCYALFGGNCYDNACPSGTTLGQQIFFDWTTCPINQVCCQGTPETTTLPPPDCANSDLCGRWGPTARLAFSQTQIPRQSPYQVSLRRRQDKTQEISLANSAHLGGAALIHNNWVITDPVAAITVGRALSNMSYTEDMLVVAGEYNTKYPEVYNNVPQEQVRRVKQVIFHPSFRYTTASTLDGVFRDGGDYQANAFALIQLEESIVYNDWVRPICLPTSAECTDGVSCRVTGWGLDESEILKDLLQVSYVDLFTKSVCETIEGYAIGGAPATLPATTRCASNEQSTGSCLGDFGGPLACDDPNNGYRATLFGLQTFSTRCDTTTPILISDVGSVADWVWDTCRVNP